MESSSRPKRSTRNQKPSYTFKTEEDFVAKLTEKRKNEILELLKREFGRPSKLADVGSEKLLEKIARKTGIPPKDLRELLDNTDDLTQVTGSSLSSKKKDKLSSMASPNKDIVKKLDEEVGSLQRQLDELQEKFQMGCLPSDEALMELQEEIQQATEQVEEAVKLLPAEGKGSLMFKDEESLGLVQSKPLYSDEDDPMEMDLSMGEVPDVGRVEKMEESQHKVQDEEKTDMLVEMEASGELEKDEE